MSDALTAVWKTAREVLGVVAPTIATALGGPLAGQAVQFVTQALGLAPDATHQDITARLQSATPAELLVLKKQDQDFAKAMRELDIKVDQIAYDDRADARSRQVQTNDRTTFVLAWVTVLFTFAIVTLILTGYAEVKGEFQATVVGVVLAVFKDVYGFIYGSSMGSKQKGDDMGRALSAR